MRKVRLKGGASLPTLPTLPVLLLTILHHMSSLPDEWLMGQSLWGHVESGFFEGKGCEDTASDQET